MNLPMTFIALSLPFFFALNFVQSGSFGGT